MTPEESNALRRITRRLREVGPFIADEAKLIESLLPPAEGVTHTQAEGRRASAAPRECEVTAAAHGPQAANDSGIDARANAANKRHCESIIETWRKLNVGPRRRTAKAIDDMAAITEQVKDGELTPLEGLRRIATSLSVPQLLDVVVEGKAKTEPLIAQELDVDLGPVAGWARHEPFAEQKPLRFSCSKPVTVGDQCEHVDVGMRSMSGLMEVVAIDREQQMLTTVSDKGTVNAQLRVIPAKALQFVPNTEQKFHVVDKTEPAATPTIAPPAQKYLSGEDPQLNDEVNAPIERIASTAIVDGISWGSGLVMVRSIFAKHEYGYFEPQWVRIDECRLIERASHKPQPEPKREPTIADQKPLLDRYAEEEPPTEFHAAVAPIAEHMQQKLDEGRSAVERIEQAMAEAGIDPRPVLCTLSDGTEVRKGDRLWHEQRACVVTIDRAHHDPAISVIAKDPRMPLIAPMQMYVASLRKPTPTELAAWPEVRENPTAASPGAGGKPLTPGEMDKIVEETLPKVKKWVRAKPLPTERPARRKSRNRDAAASKPVKTATPKVKATSDRGRSRPATRTKPAKTRAKQRKPAAKASKPGRNPGIR